MIDALLGTPVAKGSVESLYAEHGRDLPWPYWLLWLMVIAAVVVIAVVEVDVSVRIPTALRPKTEQIPVRTGVSGVVRELRAKENQIVKANETLLVVDSDSLDHELAKRWQIFTDNSIRVHDYEALLSWWSDTASTRSEASQPKSNRAMDPLKLPALSTTSIQEEARQLTATLSGLELQLDRSARELARYTPLHAKGLVADSELQQHQYEFDSGLSGLRLTVQQYVTRWQSTKHDLKIQSETLATEMRVLEAQKTQHQILSPVGGSLLGFNEISVGSFINAGQTVGNISSDDELVAEGMVATKDIGLLRLGQVAKVQVSAFSYTEWGQLAGTVDTITADAIRLAQASQYRVLIRLSGKTLTSADGKEVSVHKGMTGMARIVVARRRLWQMLWETTADWVNPYDAPTGQTARP